MVRVILLPVQKKICCIGAVIYTKYTYRRRVMLIRIDHNTLKEMGRNPDLVPLDCHIFFHLGRKLVCNFLQVTEGCHHFQTSTVVRTSSQMGIQLKFGNESSSGGFTNYKVVDSAYKYRDLPCRLPGDLMKIVNTSFSAAFGWYCR